MAMSTTLAPQRGGGQSITTSGTSARTANKAPAGCREVRIECLTADAYIAFDSDASAEAGATDLYMTAGKTEYFPIPHGAYVHALQVTSAGTIKTHWMMGS